MKYVTISACVCQGPSWTKFTKRFQHHPNHHHDTKSELGCRGRGNEVYCAWRGRILCHKEKTSFFVAAYFSANFVNALKGRKKYIRVTYLRTIMNSWKNNPLYKKQKTKQKWSRKIVFSKNVWTSDLCPALSFMQAKAAAINGGGAKVVILAIFGFYKI